jgi:hypothetical protein
VYKVPQCTVLLELENCFAEWVSESGLSPETKIVLKCPSALLFHSCELIFLKLEFLISCRQSQCTPSLTSLQWELERRRIWSSLVDRLFKPAGKVPYFIINLPAGPQSAGQQFRTSLPDFPPPPMWLWTHHPP